MVAHDGTVFEPISVWPELEPSMAWGRTLVPFGDVVQAILAKIVPTMLSCTLIVNVMVPAPV